MSKSVITKKVVERDERNAEARSALYELLRAGLVWRDARKAVFGRMGDYRKMDQYSEACDALEKQLDAIQPPASSVQAPPTLEEALEASVVAVEQGKKVRRG